MARSITTPTTSCPTTFVRREIREYIDPTDPTGNTLTGSGKLYIDGVHCLMASTSPSNPSQSVWDDFTRTHLDNVAAAHGMRESFGFGWLWW